MVVFVIFYTTDTKLSKGLFSTCEGLTTTEKSGYPARTSLNLLQEVIFIRKHIEKAVK